jgi:hypothetical protein
MPTKVFSSELVPLGKSRHHTGIGLSTLKRLAAIDPAFPPLIRISPKLTLVDVPAVTAYLRARAGIPPRRIRGLSNKELGATK